MLKNERARNQIGERDSQRFRVVGYVQRLRRKGPTSTGCPSFTLYLIPVRSSSTMSSAFCFPRSKRCEGHPARMRDLALIIAFREYFFLVTFTSNDISDVRIFYVYLMIFKLNPLNGNFINYILLFHYPCQ